MSNDNRDWLGLSGQVCTVTGAAGGIGKAIAAEFVAAGALVALVDRDQDLAKAAATEIDPSGERAFAFACDVSDIGSIRDIESSIKQRMGMCTLLVNNAAILKQGALENIAIEDWNTLLDVNLTGYLRCSQVFGAGMLARGQGALVHVASISATHPQAFSGAYSPGKAAVAMLSRQLAFEWGPRGVRSNVVSPGMIETPLSASFYSVPGIRERRAAVVPMRRTGHPQDIASAVVFLASQRAGYVNGQELLVDGGYAQTLMSHIPRPGYD